MPAKEISLESHEPSLKGDSGQSSEDHEGDTLCGGCSGLECCGVYLMFPQSFMCPQVGLWGDDSIIRS